jgi:hypothetical protein
LYRPKAELKRRESRDRRRNPFLNPRSRVLDPFFTNYEAAIVSNQASSTKNRSDSPSEPSGRFKIVKALEFKFLIKVSNTYFTRFQQFLKIKEEEGFKSAESESEI